MKSESKRTEDALQEAADVASATECTGLMPALPQDDAADVASAALYEIHDARGARDKRYSK